MVETVSKMLWGNCNAHVLQICSACSKYAQLAPQIDMSKCLRLLLPSLAFIAVSLFGTEDIALCLCSLSVFVQCVLHACDACSELIYQ